MATSASSRTQRMRVPKTRGDTRMAMRSSVAASARPAGASLAPAAVTTTWPRRALPQGAGAVRRGCASLAVRPHVSGEIRASAL